VKDAKGSTQGYQKELANIQRSLNLRVDTGRDLTAQITDLGQAMRKIQKENESLANQIRSLRTNLEAQQAANARLVGDNEELKAGNRKLQITISALTSKEDSLGKKYMDMRNAKEKLDDFAQSIGALRTRIVSESAEGGIYRGKANIYVKSVLLGSFDWSIPENLNREETGSGEASFSAESIDYVRVNPEERHILRSFGDRYKIRVDIASDTDSMTITPDKNEQVHEIGERDRSSWRWSIRNSGMQDARLVLTARIINKDSNEISLLQQEHAVTSSNMVRQFRGYLKPVPLIAGILLGFILFGIVGIFRRPKNPADHSKNPPSGSSDPPSYMEKKQL
jgi:hypothetical protein